MRKIAACLVLVVMVAAGFPAAADDYESGRDGDSVYPVKSTAVRMASERVEVFVEWATERGGHAKMRVAAEFVLVNDSTEPHATLVSFPASYYDEKFTRTVDGQKVAVPKYPVKDPEGLVRYYDAYTSEIRFEPRQTRRVGVTYVAAADARSGWPPYPAGWSYILRTGALWKEKIGEAQVIVHFPEAMPPGGFGPFRSEAMLLCPPGYEVNGRTVTWTFKDFEPDEDIYIEWDDGLVLAASDPLRLAPRDEAPGLQLEMAMSLIHNHSHHAIVALKELREAFPQSAEAKLVDYYIGCAYTHFYPSGGRLEGVGWKPYAAAQHYEAALRQPLDDTRRRDALAQLFVLYTQELRETAKADRTLARLKKENLSLSEHGELLEMVGLASPEGGLTLLEAMKVGPDDALQAKKLRDRLESERHSRQAPPAQAKAQDGS
jgi:hypothetical protein